jgi:protein SCO1/2
MSHRHFTRRQATSRLAAMVACAAGTPAAARVVVAAAASRDEAVSAHFPFGIVAPPRPLPAGPVQTHLGQSTELRALLEGRATALQLMFTGCSATCPIQGALFAQTQTLLARHAATAVPMQLLSLSIDPLSDSPQALAGWLRRSGAGTGTPWIAAAPRVADVDRLVTLLGSGGEPKPRGSDPHTGQVYIVDRKGQLVWRTPSLPPPAEIIKALASVAT